MTYIHAYKPNFARVGIGSQHESRAIACRVNSTSIDAAMEDANKLGHCGAETGISIRNGNCNSPTQ